MGSFLTVEHRIDVPLDYRDPDGPTIGLFAREVVAAEHQDRPLPWLLFLQGGPGRPAPRPVRADGWLGRALRTHRVVLMDQRGTGLSTPVTARTAHARPAAELAAYLRHFRADSIVADAERLRARITGGQPWETLGQSYGGFVTLTYLSMAPEGLRACYVTGGLPGLAATAADVYARTYPRVADRNAAYYRRYPGDVEAVRRIADYCDRTDVRLPDGDRLTTRRLRLLGQEFGMRDGAAGLHWLLEQAWDGPDLAHAFRERVMVSTSYADAALFVLQEYVYGQGQPTGWAAEAARHHHPAFADDATPLLFTGEMMFPWMFSDIAALRPFADAAEHLAAVADWPALYDPARLAANRVPLAATVYFDDMYVDANLSLETARAVDRCRVWVTNEHEHDGLRMAGEAVLGRLMDLAADIP
jgi:pimeloyl-ACP methyl ester carboxylesterase